MLYLFKYSSDKKNHFNLNLILLTLIKLSNNKHNNYIQCNLSKIPILFMLNYEIKNIHVFKLQFNISSPSHQRNAINANTSIYI